MLSTEQNKSRNPTFVLKERTNVSIEIEFDIFNKINIRTIIKEIRARTLYIKLITQNYNNQTHRML